MFQLREFQILSSDSKGNIWKLGRRIAAEILNFGRLLKEEPFYAFRLFLLFH